MHTSPRGSDSKSCHELSMQPQGHHNTEASSPSLTADRNKMHFLALPTLSASSGHNCPSATQPLTGNGVSCLSWDLQMSQNPVSPQKAEIRDSQGRISAAALTQLRPHQQHQGSHFIPHRKYSRSCSKGVNENISLTPHSGTKGKTLFFKTSLRPRT